ncbi:MAG: hypothetical protein ABIF10_01445 [Candidatus Woesearchaeota archaeon]
MVSTFREIIIFFDKIGVYDVILPFLLVFTIIFAILEKTKVFGQEEVSGKKVTRKNMNAMVSFVISFFVIASASLVEIITTVSSWMVLLLLLSVLFLILVGSFWKEGEGTFLEGRWRSMFMVIMFVGIVAIFLYAIKTESGEPWLEFILRYVYENFASTFVASIILMAVVIGLVWFIIHEPKVSQAAKKE